MRFSELPSRCLLAKRLMPRGTISTSLLSAAINQLFERLVNSLISVFSNLFISGCLTFLGLASCAKRRWVGETQGLVPSSINYSMAHSRPVK